MYGLRNHVFGPLRDGSAADNCKAGPEGLFCAANRFAGAVLWDNPKVREELKKVVLFWKEKGVRGFRLRRGESHLQAG